MNTTLNEDCYLNECADILTDIYIRINSDVFIPVPKYYLNLTSMSYFNENEEETDKRNTRYRDRAHNYVYNFQKSMADHLTDEENKEFEDSLVRLQQNNFKAIDKKINIEEDPRAERTKISDFFLDTHYVRKLFRKNLEKIKDDKDAGRISLSAYNKMKHNFVGCLIFLANPQNWAKVIRRLRRSKRPFSDLLNIAMEVRGAELKAQARKLSNMDDSLLNSGRKGKKFVKNELEFKDGSDEGETYGWVGDLKHEEEYRNSIKDKIRGKILRGSVLQSEAAKNRTKPREYSEKTKKLLADVKKMKESKK